MDIFQTIIMSPFVIYLLLNIKFLLGCIDYKLMLWTRQTVVIVLLAFVSTLLMIVHEK